MTISSLTSSALYVDFAGMVKTYMKSLSVHQNIFSFINIKAWHVLLINLSTERLEIVLKKMSNTVRDTNSCFLSFKAEGRELTDLPRSPPLFPPLHKTAVFEENGIKTDERRCHTDSSTKKMKQLWLLKWY